MKAQRIVEVQKQIESAEKELDAAKANCQKALSNQRTVDSDEEKKRAEEDVDKALANVIKAEKQLEFLRDDLKKLVECDSQKWYRSIPWMSIASFALFGILGWVVLTQLTSGFQKDGLLETLQDIATARGLITFLVTLVTVTIALILALSTIVSSSPDRNERFKDGKDLLFALIGVLGTIVGFYFGQVTPSDGELSISPAIVADANPGAGDNVSVISFVTGGQAPYTYEFSFEPKGVVDPVPPFESKDGLLQKEITINREAKNKVVTFTIKATDRRGKATSSEASTLTVKP